MILKIISSNIREWVINQTIVHKTTQLDKYCIWRSTRKGTLSWKSQFCTGSVRCSIRANVFERWGVPPPLPRTYNCILTSTRARAVHVQLYFSLSFYNFVCTRHGKMCWWMEGAAFMRLDVERRTSKIWSTLQLSHKRSRKKRIDWHLGSQQEGALLKSILAKFPEFF